MLHEDNLLEPVTDKKCEILNSFIKEFKTQHPYLSSNQIAKKLDIPQSTLNRIENHATNPSLENVLNVLIATGNESRVAEILSVLFPQHKKKYDQIFSANLETPLLDKYSCECATSEETFLIIQLAFTRKGTTRQEIRERFGSFGLGKLEQLLKDQVLLEGNEGVITADCEKVNVSFGDLKKIIQMAIEKCYHSETGHLSYQTESVSQEGLDLIFQELKRTQVQIRKILYNPQYYGGERVFVGLVGDRLIKNEVDYN
ncbi:MAG: hypothetical protein A2577_00615 [Bdellovibrionales bacterium RIFOXYD1_FULL_36_51]|nr:MAG: hypothetical protein A2181_06160 [Bdellovibrionales bacterium RIFOXYA1_FULL_38_20]OFZ49297.1 MAG: hypothetical protein A2417_17335 [Bdellovibrionales bacterium RIFOXYC1_FULL_37_79]OFZ61558.1 MAG: hypothetical protein A2577_00615 [Bdellovibrionales bacterium RIFOXYD1_FULL_36_51]